MSFKDKIKKFVPPSARTFQSFVEESRAVYQMLTSTSPEVQLYYNTFELNYLQEHGFFIAIKGNDFEERYFKLIKGLDEASVECVNHIVKRIQILEECRFLPLPLDIYTLKEKNNISILHDWASQDIIKISDDCFAYKNYKLPLCHFEPCVFLDKHGISQIETDLDILAERDIIDAGGFIGDSVLVLSPYTKRKTYTFEPMPYNFSNMQKTMQLNNIQNVVCENSALGSQHGFIDFYMYSEQESCSCKADEKTNSKKTEKVPVITLDEYVKEHNLHVGLIKTDLEGMEQEFLLGAKETITTQKPVLLLSMYHNDEDFFGLKPLLESWELGYSFKVFKGLDYGICLETMLIAEVL